MAVKKEYSDSEINTLVKKLDCTASAGKAREAEYSEIGAQQTPLRKRYRIGGRTYSKGGTSGNGHSGTSKHKVPAKDQKVGPKKIMNVNGLTGSKRMVIAE